MKSNGLCRLLLVAQLLLFPMALDSAASCVGLVLQDTGGGGYRVVARGLVNVGAIDFTLTYDKTSLSSPRVVRGDMAEWLIFLPNVSETSGTVRVAMVNEPPVSGSGTVATVTFTPRGTTWGKPALTCQLTGLDASNQPINSPLSSDASSNTNQSEVPLPYTTRPKDSVEPPVTTKSPVTIEPPVTTEPLVPGEQAQQGQQGQQGQQSRGAEQEGSPGVAVSTAPYVVAGAINLGGTGLAEDVPEPSDESSGEQDATAPAPGEQPAQWPFVGGQEEAEYPPSSSEPASLAPQASSSTREPNYVVYKGMIERFREYQGARTPQALMALFEAPVSPVIEQDPLICLSDGTMLLKVLVQLPEGGTSAPNFALRGASLKSLKKRGDNRWSIEAVPETGRLEAMLTIVNGEQVTDYPLTIAPRITVNLDKKPATDEADFSLFLAGKTPADDLNGDGQRDYVDDYIYTANYLAAKGVEKIKKK